MNYRIKIHQGWIILTVGFITLLVAYGIRIGAYSVLLPEMIRDLHLTKAEAGMIKSAFGISYLIFSPLMGLLTDLIGARKVISFFCLFLGGGSFLMGYAESFIASSIFFFIVGLGASATWVPITTLIQRWFGEKKRGLALGILSPSYGIGFGMMGLILPVIVSRYSWRMGWQLLGILGLGLIVLNGFLMRDDPKIIGIYPWGEDVTPEETSTFLTRMSYFEVFKTHKFWIIGISYFLISFGVYTIVDFIVTYGTLELNISYRISSLFITLIAFSGVAGGFILTTISDYIGRKRSLIIIQSSITMGIFLILWSGNHISYLIFATLFFGFLYGAIWPLYATCVRDYFPRDMAGTILGLLTIFYGVGVMISPFLTGYIADTTGTFRWAFFLSGLGSLCSAFIIGCLEKKNVGK